MNRLIRRILALCIVVVSCLAGCREERTVQEPPRQERPEVEGTIVAVGDSLTAGLGVDEADAYPALLERRLREGGHPWRVVNAGISGETSSGTLSRAGWILTTKPDIVILETGANDGLRGVDPRLTQRNIDEIVSRLRERNVVVVLAGMRMVTNLGREYTEAFASIYPAVARKHGLILIPFFLEGVAGVPSLNQPDGVHPTAEGYRVVAGTVYPYVLMAIEKAKKSQATPEPSRRK